MCGIFGVIGKVNREKITSCNREMIKRGPDAEGYWFDSEDDVALAHRRLAVVELSEAGAQPMISSSQRFVISYNGEIYNPEEIKAKIPGVVWRGHSDTEALLESSARFGFFETLKMAVGMFAIALWDKETKTLFLARDRMGEKPLYYGYVDGSFAFGSQISALRGLSSAEMKLNLNAVSDVVKHSCVVGEKTIYEGIYKLPPGGWLQITAAEVRQQKIPTVEKYWEIKKIPKLSQAPSNTLEQLETLLKHSVKSQMMADVPLGAFLSGGIDSSLIVSLMQSQSSRKVKTFTIGYDDANYNEANHARAVADHLGTDHTEFIVKPIDLLNEVENLPKTYDEPFADSSQLPTMLVSRLARKHVTVALSGDAGDELFAGYNRHLFFAKFWPKIEKIPWALRKVAGSSVEMIPSYIWKTLLSGAEGSVALPHEKVFKIAKVLQCEDPTAMYSALTQFWYREKVLKHEFAPNNFGEIKTLDDICRADASWYLPDDVLVKVDRAAMSQSLETRAPFLDHRVVEFAFSLPMKMNIADGKGKLLLREILYKYVPKEILDRPKMGFGVPLDSWLRGELKDWAEGLLSREMLEKQGLFNADIVRKKWDQHQKNERDWQHDLWNVLMIQLWLKKNINS